MAMICTRIIVKIITCEQLVIDIIDFNLCLIYGKKKPPIIAEECFVEIFES